MKTGICLRVSVLAVSAFLFSSVSSLQAQDSSKATVLINPGFEEGVKSWDISSLIDKSGGICDTVFHQGKYSALIKCKGEGKMQHVSQQMYSAPAGSKVACSVWVKTSKPETEYLIYWDITAQREGRDPEWFSGHDAGLQKNANTEWKEVKFSFTAPADKVDKDGNFRKICFFFLRLSTPDKYSGDIWFDDVSVVVTPPSSSVSDKVVSEPADPSKIRWELNSGDELESINNFDDVTYNDGEFSGKTKYDPSICLKLPTKEIDANDYKVLKIRLYSSAMFGSLDVFYSSPNKEWCMGSADVKIEQGWKEYVIDLNKVKWRAEEASSANAAKWGGTTGKVSAVRIDPGNEADRTVKVDWVELLKK